MDLRQVLPLLATTCGGSPEPPSPVQPAFEAVAPAEAEPAPTGLDAKRARLAAWSRCAYRVGNHVERSWARYATDVDPTRHRVRPTAMPPFIDPPGPDLTACPVHEPALAGGSLAVAEAGRRFTVAASQYGRDATRLQAYFDDEAHAASHWARVSAWGPALAAAYGEARAAKQALSAALDRARDEADARWLARLEAEEGQLARWHLTRTTVSARSTRPCLAAARRPSTACSEALHEFAQARAAFEAYRAGHRPEAATIFWLDVFRLQAEHLEQAGARLSVPLSSRGTAPSRPAQTRVQSFAHARADLQAAADTVLFGFP